MFTPKRPNQGVTSPWQPMMCPPPPAAKPIIATIASAPEALIFPSKMPSNSFISDTDHQQTVNTESSSTAGLDGFFLASPHARFRSISLDGEADAQAGNIIRLRPRASVALLPRRGHHPVMRDNETTE